MAEQLSEFTFSGKGSRSVYDWDAWFDGGIWKLTAGEDFSTTADLARHAAYAAAKRRNLKIRTKVVGDDLVLQVSG